MNTKRTVFTVRLSFYFDIEEKNEQTTDFFMAALTCAVTSCLGSTGCKDTPQSLFWETEYSYDVDGHWSACADCDEKKDVGAHVLSSLSCEVCAYLFTPTDRLVYEVPDDGTHTTLTSITAPLQMSSFHQPTREYRYGN